MLHACASVPALNLNLNPTAEQPLKICALSQTQVQPEAPARKCSSSALIDVQADDFSIFYSHAFNNRCNEDSGCSLGDAHFFRKSNGKNQLFVRPLFPVALLVRSA